MNSEVHGTPSNIRNTVLFPSFLTVYMLVLVDRPGITAVQASFLGSRY